MRFYSLLLAVALLTSAAPWAVAAKAELARKPRHGGIYVAAHRGAHQGIPENTVAAYKKAVELGVDFIEVDARLSKDGVLVSVHNADVDAYTKGAVKGKVKDFTLAELKAMDIGSRVGPEWKNERIPTLEEALAVCQGKVGVYLDLKEAPVAQVVDLLRKYNMERDTLWYADVNELKELAKICPEGLAMPDPPSAADLPEILKTLQPPASAPAYNLVTPEYIKQCHEAGVMVLVDEEGKESWDKLLGLGVDGIQTDFPEELIKYLETRAKKPAGSATP